MKRARYLHIRSVLLCVLVLSGGSAGAARVVECVDRQGNVSFMDHCPPEMTAKQERQYGRKPKPYTQEEETSQPDTPITLYSVPLCDSCDGARYFLDSRKLPYTEKNIQGNVELQTELKELAGQLTVPVIVVGDEILRGYDSSTLSRVLAGAGYDVEAPKVQTPAAEPESDET